MKKSLSLLLSIALVFGLFASMASAAETADLTVAQKYQALKDKGILKGTTTGSDGLDDKLTRAQFATIAIALAGLAPATEGNTFSDVNNKQWWYGAIEAAAKAGLVEGSNGKFDPKGDVTVEQVIVIAARILKLEEVKDAKVEGASAWAVGYIQAAIDKGLTAARTDYTKQATRGQAIEVGYTAYVTANPVEPAKTSVTSAKAAGVKKVAVTLDKAVDDTKATLTLKRNTSTIATKTTWSEDKKTATLELDTAKIIEGEYTVTLGGLAEADIATASASFKAENEKVVKLDFKAPSDTLAQANKVKVQFEALNQYDEAVSLAAGSFNAYASTPSGANVQKDANGNLFVVIDTDDATLIPNVAQISISILNVESQITINKTFKLGSKPYVAKVELGKIVYSNGADYLSKSGDKAVIELIQYDQYGHRISLESSSLFTATANVVPYLAELSTPAVTDDNNDQVEDVVVSLTADAKASGEYTVSVFGGSTASTKINIKSTQYAAKVELDNSTTLATGDTDKYIGVTAYDKEGNKLSAQDIVDNYRTGHIQFSSSANLAFATSGTLLQNQGGQYAIVKAGEHKGKLFIPAVGAKGMANIFVNITPSSANGIVFNQNFTFTIQERRYPVSLKVNTDNAKKAIPDATNTAESTLKVTAIDQFGDAIKGTIGPILESTRSVTYDVYVQTVASSTGVTFNGSLGAHTDLGVVLDKDLKFIAAAGATAGDYTVKISLRKLSQDGSQVIDDSVASVTKGMRIIPKTTKLTYSVKGIDTLFAAIDDPAMKDKAANDGFYDSVGSKHARTVEIEAKDGSADTVALPGNYVIGVSASDSRIVAADTIRKIVGNKAGTTQLAITHLQADGGSNTVYKEVTVKSDPITVAKLGSDATSTKTEAQINAWSAAHIMNLKVTDSYNTEYGVAFDTNGDPTDNFVVEYDKLLGVRYSVSDIQGGITVTVSPLGVVTTNGEGSFTLTASSPNGKTAVTAVVVEN